MNHFSALATAFLGMASPGAAFMAPKLSGTPTVLNLDGWKGGFSESEEKFSYPRLAPDMSDIKIMDNMDNIDKLTRMQKVMWPQFSWESILGDPSSRTYQMFAPDISRLGYTDDGQIFSIICPQQGYGSALIGEMNVEVTVTGCRGWCNEADRDLYADLGVKGRIWFTSDDRTLPLLKGLEEILGANNFPFSKEHSINVTTHNKREPWNPIFRLKNGTAPEFPHPEFTQHWDEAFGVGHLNVQVGAMELTGDEKVDEFNQMILNIFNLISGNILTDGNTLSWNVWFTEPEPVNQTEWKNHADKWRTSLDVEHRYPVDGYKNIHDQQTYFDGTEYKPLKGAAIAEAKYINAFVKKHKKKRLDDAKEHLFGVIGGIDEKFFHHRD